MVTYRRRLEELETRARRLQVYAVAAQVADRVGIPVEALLEEAERLAGLAEVNGWTIEEQLMSELGDDADRVRREAARLMPDAGSSG